MKTFFLLFFSFFFISLLSAQFLRGNLVTGGNIMYVSNTQDGNANSFNQGTVDNKSTEFEIAPAIGFVINENLVLGTFLSYSKQKIDFSFNSSFGGFEQIQERENDLFSIIPFLRYYKTVADKFGLTFELNVRFGFGSGEDTRSVFNGNDIELLTNRIDVSEFSLGASPGIFYKLNDSFIIRASIGNLSYLSRKEKFEDDLNVPLQNEQRSFNLNLSDNLSLSFEYFFGAKGG